VKAKTKSGDNLMLRIEELIYSDSYPSWEDSDFELFNLSDAELHEYAEADSIQTNATRTSADSALTAK
jgi:hypothetical protein